MGNTEKREIYKQFELKNLNTNAMDYTHYTYQNYLENNFFIPPGDQAFFAHMKNRNIPLAPTANDEKGLFNCFPLALDSQELLNRKNVSANLGNPSFFLNYFFCKYLL